MSPKEKPARVLLLADSPYMGGITSHLVSLLQAFRDHPYFQLHLATLPGRRDDKTLLEQARAHGFPVREIPMRGRFDWRTPRLLRDWIRQEDFSLVHTHNYRATLLLRAARISIPKVISCHGQLVAPTLALRFWQHLFLREMRHHAPVVACSNAVRDWLLHRGVPAGAVRVVYNAVADPAPREDRSPGTSGELTLLYVGRLARGKGLEWLLRVLPEKGCRLFCVGDGPLRFSLEKMARARDLPVVFPGQTSDLSAWYRRADCVVLPSEQEALPMCLIEAAAWGLPVVSTRVGGIPEIVRDEETGLLVSPGDESALRAAIERLREPRLRYTLGRHARERWRQLFSLPCLADAMAGVYREALRTASSSASPVK